MVNNQKQESTIASGSKASFSLENDRDRRLGIDRRRFSYDVHIPERRSGTERRRGTESGNGTERKNGVGFRMSPKERSDMERRASFV